MIKSSPSGASSTKRRGAQIEEVGSDAVEVARRGDGISRQQQGGGECGSPLSGNPAEAQLARSQPLSGRVGPAVALVTALRPPGRWR